MAKRLTDKQKEEITEFFVKGRTLEQLSKQFNCTSLTISRNLKKQLGDLNFKQLVNKRKLSKIPTGNYQDSFLNKNNQTNEKNNEETFYLKDINKNQEEIELSENPFMEIIPLDYEIDNLPQNDLASVPISEVDFPKIVFMIVDKKIELETKYLKDYPEWQFLSQKELNRKTIEIFEDLKTAKRFCNKEQKVIKIPNTYIFKMVAPILLSKGISRIVCPGKLISL